MNKATLFISLSHVLVLLFLLVHFLLQHFLQFVDTLAFACRLS
jgi:hypothetical protein